MVNRHSRRPASDAPRLRGGIAPSDLATLAGYRVLRTLSSGERADIYLGHAPLGRNTNVVAIKVFGLEADPASVDREITALGATAPGCLPRLIDVATLADGRTVLVMERLGGGTLGSLLLRRRGQLQPGEAVTVIAPVVVALAAVHAIGLVHPALSPGTVTFDEDGRPVLTGLGGLRDLPAFGPRGGGTGAPGASRLDLVRDDYARLTALMRAVFDCLDRGTPAARQSEFLAAWFEGATSAVPFHPCLDELERRLFEWAPAVPVRREGPEPPSPRNTPGRIVSPTSDVQLQAESPGDVATHRLPQWLGLLHLPEELAPTLVRALDDAPGASLLRRARARMKGKRRAVIVAVCVATATAVLALTLLAPVDGPSDRGTEPTAAAAGTEPQKEDAPTAGIDHTALAAITGDDPVAAVPHLLAARSACLARVSGDCLAGADQASSPIMAADLERSRRAQAGETSSPGSDYALFAAVLIERTGNSALVALEPAADAADNKPASLLVIKGEAGWRLREIFEAVAGSE